MRKIRYVALTVLGVYLASLIYVVSFGTVRNVPQHADAVVVLGALVHLDNTPSQTLYNRAVEAAKLYREGRANYVITTGGVGLGSMPESAAAADVLVQNGVPRQKILSEANSHSTYANFSEISGLAQEHNVRSVIVVSDESHVARGVLVAKAFKYQPVYWDFPTFTAYASPQEISWDYLREAAAMLLYVPRTLLQR